MRASYKKYFHHNFQWWKNITFFCAAAKWLNLFLSRNESKNWGKLIEKKTFWTVSLGCVVVECFIKCLYKLWLEFKEPQVYFLMSDEKATVRNKYKSDTSSVIPDLYETTEHKALPKLCPSIWLKLGISSRFLSICS